MHKDEINELLRTDPEFVSSILDGYFGKYKIISNYTNEVEIFVPDNVYDLVMFPPSVVTRRNTAIRIYKCKMKSLPIYFSRKLNKCPLL